jgi:hypothetical protein
MNFLRCEHWKWLIQHFTTREWENWENCENAAATAQSAMGYHGVLCIWKDSGTDASSEGALDIIGGFKNTQHKLVNWLLIYQQFMIHWNWPYHMDWETTDSACSHSHSVWRCYGRILIQRQSLSHMISVVCAGNRKNTASLFMKW